MKKILVLFIPVWILASCTAMNQQQSSKADIPRFYESTPSTKVDRSKLQEVCPDFSGTYRSSVLESDITFVTQTGCESIYMSVEGPAFTFRNTYNLDGISITVKKFVMGSIPCTASFIDRALWIECHGNGFVEYAVWRLDENNGLDRVVYFVRDGEWSKYSEVLYYRVEEE